MSDMTQETPSDVSRVTRDELRAFVDRYERLEQEKKDIADGQKEVVAELKGRGYDAAAFKAILKIRAADPAKQSEFEAILELYKETLGV